jgi:HEAT repeat protein
MFIARSHWRPAVLSSIAISFCISLLCQSLLPAQSDSFPPGQKSDASPQLDLLREQLDSPDPSQRAQGIQHIAQLDKKWATLALPRLIKLLGDESRAQLGNMTSQNRIHAIAALAQMGPWVSEQVIEALDDKNRLVRMGAADVLANLREPRAIDPLIKLLRDPDQEVAGHAWQPLSAIGEPSIQRLLEVASDENAFVRSCAANALARIREPNVVQPVARLLFDPDEHVRNSAGESLALLARASLAVTGRPSDKARQEKDSVLEKLVIEQLNAALRSQNSAARLAAARSAFFSAARSESLETIDALASCLSDDDATLRAQAVHDLSQVQRVEVYKPLAASLHDADSRVREMAANGLTYRLANDRYRPNILQFDDGFLVQPLIENLSYSDPRVRRAAAEALVQVRSPSKLDAAATLIKLLHDDSPEVISVALRTLAAIRPKEAADPIFALLDGPALRSEAAVALSAFGDPRAVPPLHALAKEKDLPAIGALGTIKDRESVPMLIEFLKDENKGVHPAVVNSLASIGDPRAAAPLIRLLETDPELTSSVADALGKFKDPRAVQPMIDAIPREQERNDARQLNFSFRIDRGPMNNPLAVPLERMGFVAIEPLARALSSPSQATREVSAWVLYNLMAPSDGIDREDMQPAIEPLVTALADPSAIVRHHAAMTLGRLGDRRAVPELIETAKDSDQQSLLYSNAAAYLNTIKDPESVPPLISLLSNPKPPVRATAARALGYLKDERAFAQLLVTLKDDSPVVRAAAAAALGQLKAAPALEPLLSLLKDDETDVQLAAAEGLGRLGDKRALDPLAALLAEETALPRPALADIQPGQSQADRDFKLRVAAAIALVRLDDPRGIDAIAACLKDPLDPNREHVATQVAISNLKSQEIVPLMIAALDDPSIRVRIYAAVALGHLATSTAVDALLTKTGDRENLRNILPALAETKDDRALDAIVKSLDDADPNIRRTAAASIAILGNPAGADPLIAHVADQSTDVRAALTDALLKLKAKTALAALKSLANDEDPNVRAHAERAIKRLDR